MGNTGRKVIRNLISKKHNTNEVVVLEIDEQYGGVVNIDVTVDGVRKKLITNWKDIFIHACSMIDDLKKSRQNDNEITK